MAKAPPAFQFYPADFLTGTSRFTAADVGAYILLLCEQWHTGSVPGDDPKALALILRCTRAQARTMWAQIQHKFTRDDAAGVWRNARLEDERRRQESYRSHQSARGKKSAVLQRGQTQNSGANREIISTVVEPRLQPEGNSSSSSSVRTPSLPPSRGRRRRLTPTIQADAEHIRKTQEVKRLVHTEGLTFVEASRRAGFT